MKIVLTVSTPKNGSYIVTGAGAGLRLAVNDALREYERTAREKNRPTLNRLAKQQVFTTLQLRLEALEAADEAQVPRDRRRPGASRRPSRRAKRATRLTGR